MRINRFLFIAILILSLTYLSCQKNKIAQTSRLVIGISADVKTINPLYAFSVDEGNINEMLFLSLVKVNWNAGRGSLDDSPLLARSWEWSEDSGSVKFDLRNDVKWSDGIKLTAYDIAYSFDLYSNPQVQSKFYGTFEKLFVNDDLSVDLERSVEILDSFSLKINFVPGKNIKLIDVVFPILPKHILEKFSFEDIPSSEFNFNPITCGPYKLKKWDRNQSIILEADTNSFLYSEEMIKEIVFKVIPDYNSRITQLTKGELDIIEQIKPDDVDRLSEADHLSIVQVEGREFDYVGWNNIDPDKFNESGELRNNRFFGSAKVRIALSHAINRDAILNEYLRNVGQPAISPVSGIFREAFNNDLRPIEYNPKEAKAILESEGWSDSNNNGIIDKDGIEFSFTLYIPAGNPLRQFASTIIKNDLRAVGVDVKVERVELNKFIDDLFNKSMNAWIAAYYIQIPLENRMIWYSDFNEAPFNFVGYRNKDMDSTLDMLGRHISVKEEIELQKKFQQIIYNDQPVTFLYWINNIVGLNKKISKYEINPLGTLQHIWDWRIN